MAFELHEVEWTAEKIARFWNAMSSCDWAQTSHFSQQVGRALIHFVRRRTPLRSPILDYGAGIGSLVDYLLDETDSDIYACEFAPQSAATIQRRFKSHARFRQCAVIQEGCVPFPDEYFGAVFLVEAIEHMPTAARAAALKEIHRMLRIGGTLVITTPNDEHLEQGKTICPECGAIFHRMQHVARYDRMSLAALTEQSGFKTLHCESVQLEHYEPTLGLKGWIRRWRDRHRRYLPHLIYIGARTA